MKLKHIAGETLVASLILGNRGRERMALSYSTGQPVLMGDVVRSFRGDTYTVTGGTPPIHDLGATGRVWVRDDRGRPSEFFPSVIDCHWEVLEP